MLAQRRGMGAGQRRAAGQDGDLRAIGAIDVERAAEEMAGAGLGRRCEKGEGGTHGGASCGWIDGDRMRGRGGGYAGT